MASPAFIKYRHEEELLGAAGDDLENTYLTAILPDKLRMDLEYIEQQSFLLDLAVLAQAALSLFESSMAHHAIRRWQKRPTLTLALSL